MGQRVKYPPLIETCKKCLGCQRLENLNFTGEKNCKYAEKKLETGGNKTMYGIWNTYKKEFQFGIKEETRKKAMNKLFNKIGNDAYKYRFEVRKIPEGIKL